MSIFTKLGRITKNNFINHLILNYCCDEDLTPCLRLAIKHYNDQEQILKENKIKIKSYEKNNKPVPYDDVKNLIESYTLLKYQKEALINEIFEPTTDEDENIYALSVLNFKKTEED